MKTVFKFLGIFLGVLVLLAGGGFLYFTFTGLPHYAVKPVELKVEATASRTLRGKKLSAVLCSGCHLNPTTGRLSGKWMSDAPPEFGVIYSRNITQHKEAGIGSWTDGEIAYLLRTGINPKRDGVYTPPYMPKLPNMSDEDVHSIIAYLRSDDVPLKADATPNKEPKPSLLTKFLCTVAFKPYEYPVASIPEPDTTDPQAWGRYLANASLDCYTCHSGDFKSIDALNPEKSGGYYGGGNLMLDINGKVIHTTNITPDKTSGIGNWTEAQFIAAMKDGFRPDGSLIRYPMERYHLLSDGELKALYAFVSSVPALNPPRKENHSYVLATESNAGRTAYYKYGCQYCHGENGVGWADLRKANQKFPADSVLTDVIRFPDKYNRGTKMPTWHGVIKEEDYAALCNYVRQLSKSEPDQAQR